MNYSSIQTLGELKKANYKSRNIKDELRENLIVNIKNKVNPNLYLSMGMSKDYLTALKYGANLIRVGSKIFS